MELISKADVVLALGTRLNPFSTLPGYGIDYWPKDSKIIQVDIKADRIGLTKRISIGIDGDARQVAEQILGQLSGSAGDAGRSKREELVRKTKACASFALPCVLRAKSRHSFHRDPNHDKGHGGNSEIRWGRLMHNIATLVLSALILGSALGATAAAEEAVVPASAAVEGAVPAEPPSSMPANADEISSGAADAPAAMQSLDRIEEIVVTARKREELLEDTPIAITALSAASLENSNITRIDQIQELAPNLTIQSGGDNQTAQISIRGVGTPGVGIAFDPGVGLYIDGVYLPRAQASIFDVVDIESVQILRGPQGTLFGKNTVGGAVSVTTIKPREELGGLISVRPGNLGAIRTRVTLDIPIRIGWFEDKLFSRVTFASRNRNGYVWNKTRNEYWGEENGLSFIGSLRFLPTPDLSIDVTGSWFKDQSHNSLGQCVEVQRSGLGNAVPGFWEGCNATKPYQIAANENQIAASSSWGTWATIAWDIGDHGPFSGITAKSITSWRRQLSPSILDADATQFEVIRVANFGGGGINGQPGQAQQIQQEAQVAASAWEERINLVAGAFFFWETADRTNGLAVPVIGQQTSNQILTENFTWALFAQSTIAPVDWLSFTAGLRYTEDSKRASQLNRNYALPPEDNIVLDVSGRESFASWTPMASLALFAPEPVLDWGGLDHLMGYFTWARGFKGGGLNAALAASPEDGLVPYQPESLDNFEVGAKAIALEKRLTFNLSLFQSSYDNIQRNSFETILEPNNQITTRLLTQNAAAATIRGIEAEFQWIPIDGLLISGLIGTLDARYDKFPDAVDARGGAVPIDRSGERFIRTPKYNTFLAAQYSIPLSISGWAGGYLTPRVEWAYRAEEMFAEAEIPEARQAGYGLVNARISYDFLGDQAQIALWGRNLGDKRYANIVVPIVGPMGIMVKGYGAPRTFGAELTYTF
jgi:iron complex outermembrane receptor protein